MHRSSLQEVEEKIGINDKNVMTSLRKMSQSRDKIKCFYYIKEGHMKRNYRI